MSYTKIAIFPLCNSVSITPAEPNYETLGQANYATTIQGWQAVLPYCQKLLFSDEIVIQAHICNSGYSDTITTATDAKIYICDYNKKVIAGIDVNTTPSFKGAQSMPNNTYTDPYSLTTYSLTSFLWAFKFSDFEGYINDGGVYYVRFDNQVTNGLFPTPTVLHTTTYYSEPIYVDNVHRDTLQFKFYYDANDFDKNIIISGWFNDYGTNSVPYNPIFLQRMEGYIVTPTAKLVNIGYLQQAYQQVQVQTKQIRSWMLKLGEISLGIPYYMVEMATEATAADSLLINDYPYIRFNTSNSSTPADAWKIRRVDASPLVYAECELLDKYNSSRAIVGPPPQPYTRIFNSVFDSTFA
jgi:hypothetical protein